MPDKRLVAWPVQISLNLSDNRLSALKGISALSVLTTLCLEKNKLTILPDAISECKSLTYLDISMNQLQWLPDSFRKLTELKTLKVG